jgi:hypothetical protein
VRSYYHIDLINFILLCFIMILPDHGFNNKPKHVASTVNKGISLLIYMCLLMDKILWFLYYKKNGIPCDTHDDGPLFISIILGSLCLLSLYLYLCTCPGILYHMHQFYFLLPGHFVTVILMTFIVSE